MMPVNGGHLRGKQGMTGVDRFAIMRQHAASAADLKFLQRSQQIRLGTSNRKAALES
jgi:hypothetical protein